jgi:hypothetical protein
MVLSSIFRLRTSITTGTLLVLRNHIITRFKVVIKQFCDKFIRKNSTNIAFNSKNRKLQYDLRLFTGDGTEADKDKERKAFFLLTNSSESTYDQLISILDNNDCVYWFNQLVHRTIIISLLHKQRLMTLKKQQHLVNYCF